MNINLTNITQAPSGTVTKTQYQTIAWPVPISPNCDYPCNTTNAVTSPGIICDVSDGWNCNRCGNDKIYYNPVVPGDTLYFQLQVQNTKNAPAGVKFKAPGANYFSLPFAPKIKYNWYHNSQNASYWTIRAQIFDACDNSEYVVSGHNGIDDIIDQACIFLAQDLAASAKLMPVNAQYKWVQNLQITIPASLPVGFPDSFYIKFTIKDYANATSELYTEPFRIVTCQNTVVLEGIYNRKDCLHQVYDATGAKYPSIDLNPVPYLLDGAYLFPARNILGAYRNVIRIPGEIKHSGTNIIKDIPERQCESIKTSKQEIYRLRTQMLPPYVAEKIGLVLAGRTCYMTSDDVGTVQFPTSGNLTKNNDTGKMWILDTELQGCICLDWHQC